MSFAQSNVELCVIFICLKQNKNGCVEEGECLHVYIGRNYDER